MGYCFRKGLPKVVEQKWLAEEPSTPLYWGSFSPTFIVTTKIIVMSTIITWNSNACR
jgi:hypothetical protein